MDNNRDKLISLIVSSLNKDEKDINDEELILWLQQSHKNRCLYENLRDENYINENIEVYRRFKLYSENNSCTNSPKRDKIHHLFYSLVAVVAIIVLSFFVFTKSNKNEEFVISENVMQTEPILLVGDNVIELSDNVNIDNIENTSTTVTNKNNTVRFSDTDDNDTFQKNNVVENKIIVPYRRNHTVTLSDGTKIIINSNSKVVFPSKFIDNKRVVELEGEAYFDVAKDAFKPFIVKFNGNMVRVYGTSFNIKSTHDTDMKITLVSGSLGVTSIVGNEVVLKQGQTATINKRSSEISLDETDVNMYTSWLKDIFYYKNTKIDKVLHDLSDWYGVEFNGEKQMDIINERTITATFIRSLELEHILCSLEDILGVKFIKTSINNYDIE